MGRKAHVIKVKEEEDCQREEDDEPSSDSEDQMTLHQYFASKRKPIHPFSSSEVILYDYVLF